MAIFTPPKLGKIGRKMFVIFPAGIILVIFLATSVFIVDQAEEAVITRFGKFHIIKGPGLQFKLPFGIERNYTINVKAVQTEQFGFRTLKSGISSTYTAQTTESTMLTGDLNIDGIVFFNSERQLKLKSWPLYCVKFSKAGHHSLFGLIYNENTGCKKNNQYYPYRNYHKELPAHFAKFWRGKYCHNHLPA
jgi:hypothetical protein